MIQKYSCICKSKAVKLCHMYQPTSSLVPTRSHLGCSCTLVIHCRHFVSD